MTLKPGMQHQVLPSLFNPWVDLDLFYGKVKFAPSCVCMGTYFNINIRFPGNCWHIKSTK